MSFLALSLAVLHTGKRWFIICPVAETPMQDKESTSAHTSTAQGMTHTSCFVFLFPHLQSMMSKQHFKYDLLEEHIVYKPNWIFYFICLLLTKGLLRHLNVQCESLIWVSYIRVCLQFF